MTPANIRSILSGALWQLKTEASPALQPDAAVVRSIKGIEQSAVADVVEWLRLYTDFKNGTTRRCYVDDPFAGSDFLPGRWRGGEVKWTKDPEDPKGPAIIQQVLYRGLLTTLDPKDARLLAGRNLAGDGTNAQEDYVEVKWVGVDPDTAYDLAGATVTAAAVDALAHHKFVHDTDTVSLGTGWYHRDTLCVPREDGSFEITWRLHKPRFTLEGYADSATTRAKGFVYYFNVPKQLAQSVINAWLSAHPTGADARPSYNTEAAVCDIICSYRKLDAAIHLTGILTADNCDSSTTTAYHLGLPQNQIGGYQIGTLPAGQDGTRQVRDNGDGTWDVVIAITTRKYRDIPVYTSAEDADSKTDRKEWKGVTNLDALAADLVTDVTGARVQVRCETLDDCSKLVTKDVETAKDKTITQAVIRADMTSATTVHTQAAAALSVPAATAGQIVKGSSAPTEYKDKHRTELEIQTAVDQTITQAVERADQTSTTTIHTQAASALSVPAATAGQIVKGSSAPTEFKDKHRTELEIQTAIDQTNTQKEVSVRSVIVRTEHTAASAEELPGTFTPGVRRVVRTDGTPYKDKYRTLVEQETYTPDALSVPAYTHQRTPTYEATEEVIEDSATQPAIGATDMGEVICRRDPVTGRWNGIKRVLTYNTSFTVNADWESSDVTRSIGTDDDGRDIQIRVKRAFSEAACDLSSATLSGYERKAYAAGHASYFRRFGPGKYESLQVFRQTY